MKTYTILFIVITCAFPYCCFAQRSAQTSTIADKGITLIQSQPNDNNDLVIESYLVVETINMPFGKRIITYEVSKLDMVYTNDLGPNNTREVTPKYRKTKTKTKTSSYVLAPKFIDTSASSVVKSVKIEVIPVAEGAKYIDIDILNTYVRVLGQGYKSIDMLKEVANRYYFDSNFTQAAKYYAQLLDMTQDLDKSYYFRYAQSLKAINQNQIANEMMVLFESKNLTDQVAVKK